jgi:hypothetical protein
MLKSLLSQGFFVLSLVSLGCAPLAGEASAEPAPAEAPAEAQAELVTPAPGSAADAVLYLEQARASELAAEIELTVELDTSEAINDINDAMTSLRTAKALVLALPQTRQSGR